MFSARLNNTSTHHVSSHFSSTRSVEQSDISCPQEWPYTGRITSLAINISLSSAKLKHFSRRTDLPAHPDKRNACPAKENWLPTWISPVLPEELSEGTVCALLSCLSLLSFCSRIYSLLWSSFANSYHKHLEQFSNDCRKQWRDYYFFA